MNLKYKNIYYLFFYIKYIIILLYYYIIILLYYYIIILLYYNMKKIALLLSGNIRTFFYKNNYIARKYIELVNSQDIDVFIYTDNNDFNYNDIQYFSENNKELVLGIPNDYEKRLCVNKQLINYDDSLKIIKENFFKIFGDKLKKFHIEDFKNDLIDNIYDKNNIYHNTFMNNKYSEFTRKKALMCQFYKLYKCYNQLCNYEKENNFEYDIIMKSRMDVILFNLHEHNFRNLELNNILYTNGYGKVMTDTWAIGNRFIMNEYCNYYLYISCNMVEGIFCSVNNDWEIFKAKNIDDFRENNNIELDASDSGEFGLTYVIKYKNNYNFNYNLIDNIICLKFYDENFYNFFKDK